MFDQSQIRHGGLLVLGASGELFNHVATGGAMWTGDGDRSVEVPVVFARTFAEIPLISVALNGIDAAHDQNLRVRISPQEITTRGFTIQLSTWGDTHIARASVTWQATGKG